MKLTARNIATLSLPSDKSDVIYWDDTVPGFGLRIRKAGTRGWVFRYRFGNLQRSIKLGSANSVPLATARANASKLEAEVRLGTDPAGKKELAKQEAENTFSLLVERFLDARRRELREATIREYARHLRVDAKSLHRLPVAAVMQADIARLLNGARGAATANRLRATLSAMFVWALKEGVVLPHGNPAAYTHKRTETARDRVLSDTELKLLWAALSSDDFGNILRLLTLTGQREEEIAKLRWNEIVDGSISLPAERVKNRRAHTIPLSDSVKKILTGIERNNRVYVFGRDDTGFSGFSQAKKRLDKKLGDAVAPWRIHDLRRTAASGMQRLGVRVEVIERALNHVNGSYRGVAGVYQRDPMTAEVREALNRWARHVMALVEGRKSVVVSIRERA
jgi:integrase